MNLNQLDKWESEPIKVRNRELRKNKYLNEKREELMGRPHTNIKRSKPMGSHGVVAQGQGPSQGSEKQYKQTGPKYTGPNYPQPSVTGPLQNGGRGGKGALK